MVLLCSRGLLMESTGVRANAAVHQKVPRLSHLTVACTYQAHRVAPSPRLRHLGASARQTQTQCHVTAAAAQVPPWSAAQGIQRTLGATPSSQRRHLARQCLGCNTLAANPLPLHVLLRAMYRRSIKACVRHEIVYPKIKSRRITTPASERVPNFFIFQRNICMNP